MKYLLAPLAGFTDAPMRFICHQAGAALAFTEMVSAAGLAHGSSPTLHLAETLPGEGPVACQLFGARESDCAHAARVLSALKSAEEASQPRFCALDLNAGCPMTKVTREGAGAKLIESPGKIFLLLKAIRENTDLPVTLKTRLGPRPGERRIFEILDAAAAAGVKTVTVHARYTSQMHGGRTDLDTLAEAVRFTKLELIGNGSVVDGQSAAAMASTGVKGIMVGRAALSDPGIFARLAGQEFAYSREALFDWHLKLVLALQSRLARNFPNDHVPSPDGYASLKLRTHLFRYYAGIPGAAALRAAFNAARSLSDIAAALATVGKSLTLDKGGSSC